MSLSYQTVTLDGDIPDRQARLVFRHCGLLAVLSCLSEIHEDLAGQWFIEALFGDQPPPVKQTFQSLDEFEAWLSQG